MPITINFPISWPSSFPRTPCSLWGRPGSGRPRLLADWLPRPSSSGPRFASRAWAPPRWWCQNYLCQNIKTLALSASPANNPKSTCTPQWIQCSQLPRCCSNQSLASPSQYRPSKVIFTEQTEYPPSAPGASTSRHHSCQILWMPLSNPISMTQESSKLYTLK